MNRGATTGLAEEGAPHEERDVGEVGLWRAQVLARTCRTVFVVGVIPVVGIALLGPGLDLASRVVLLLVVAATAIGARTGKDPKLVRPVAAAFVALVIYTGVFSFLRAGVTPGGILALASGVILAGVFLGTRTGWWLLAFTTVVFLAAGLAISRGLVQITDPAVHLSPWRLTVWVRVAGAYLAATAVTFAATTALVDKLERGLRERQDALQRVLREESERRAEEHRRREAERALASAQKLEVIGRVAAGVAHDLNNALVVILSWADALDDPDVPGDERAEAVAEVRDAARRAAQVARQLVSMARRGATAPAPTDLAPVLERTVRTCERMLPADVRVRSECEAVPPVLVDEARLDQVLLNLALNAGDAMHQGGELTFALRRATLADAETLPPGAYAAIDVRDTGTGMSEETRRRAFEPFFTTKGHGIGTGLGLTSAAWIVEESRGRIRLESAPGRGTTFTVVLPLAPTAGAAAEHPPGLAPPAVSRARVLLVEDEEAVRGVMAHALRGAGHTVAEAAGVSEALAEIARAEGRFDLLCVDGILPDGSGQRVIDALNELHREARVLICSGHVEEDVLRRRINSGAYAFLAKPFSGHDLIGRVEEVLAGPPQG